MTSHPVLSSNPHPHTTPSTTTTHPRITSIPKWLPPLTLPSHPTHSRAHSPRLSRTRPHPLALATCKSSERSASRPFALSPSSLTRTDSPSQTDSPVRAFCPCLQPKKELIVVSLCSPITNLTKTHCTFLDVTSRLNYNLTYFQGNYLIIFIAITAYSM